MQERERDRQTERERERQRETERERERELKREREYIGERSTYPKPLSCSCLSVSLSSPALYPEACHWRQQYAPTGRSQDRHLSIPAPTLASCISMVRITSRSSRTSCPVSWQRSGLSPGACLDRGTHLETEQEQVLRSHLHLLASAPQLLGQLVRYLVEEVISLQPPHLVIQLPTCKDVSM